MYGNSLSVWRIGKVTYRVYCFKADLRDTKLKEKWYGHDRLSAHAHTDLSLSWHRGKGLGGGGAHRGLRTGHTGAYTS